LVTRVATITVQGESDAGPFSGTLAFSPGLQVVSAHNAFGKSLAAKAIAWCLGLEAMFGVADNDPVFLPLATRDEIDLENKKGAKVLSASCTVVLVRTDGAEVHLSRDIKGDPTIVRVAEPSINGNVRQSKLQARYKSMQDEHGGLQRFLFDWLGWPRMEVATFKGTNAELYLENLAPLFYIEQEEGWTDIQARQVSKYAQQQIGQVAVEYLLGATVAISGRLAQQSAIQREAGLRAEARTIAEHVGALFARHGWAVDWAGGGSLHETLSRWSSQTLRDALRADASADLAHEVARLNASAEALRHTLTNAPIDPADVSSHSASSQRVIELKTRRHQLNDELHTLRVQEGETTGLLASLEHRLHTAEDVLRLKTIGVGRIEHIECPTCHRDLDPATFALTDQSEASVREHIEALRRDRDLIRKNLEALSARMIGVQAELNRLESDFRDAERALVTVTDAVGTVREQLARTAANLSATERQIERLRETSAEIDELQTRIDRWLDDVREVRKEIAPDTDLARRVGIFTDALREYLIALGHSAVSVENAADIRLDEQYVPYLGHRRLKSLGSASDRSRVVAAYSLALAAASRQVHGFHPGFVILDEPLQQNPDDKHRDLFSTFLSKQLTVDAGFQTIVLTFLRQEEVTALLEQGTTVNVPAGPHFLASPPPPPPPPAEGETSSGQMDATHDTTAERPDDKTEA
jgi:DNA repair exonuclease SbcCD ATPase subunit